MSCPCPLGAEAHDASHNALRVPNPCKKGPPLKLCVCIQGPRPSKEEQRSRLTLGRLLTAGGYMLFYVIKYTSVA